MGLASAGYNVRVLDMDNGLEVVKKILTAPNPYQKDTASRISYRTMTEKRKVVGGRLLPGGNVWADVTKMLGEWNDGKNQFGSIYTWTEKEVLYVDSFSFLGKAAFNWILSMNARLGQTPHQSDYNLAQQLLEEFLSTLYSDHVKCNVVICFHIQLITKGGIDHDYLEGVGKALSPKIPRYFNNIVMLRKTGQGANEKRTLHTKGVPGVTLELKSSNPAMVKPTYDQVFGLAEYFADLRRTS